jgi:hypothetical protein
VKQYGAAFEFQDAGDGRVKIGEDGSHCKTLAGAIWFDKLKLCGCGDPDLVREFIVSLLTSGKPWQEGGDVKPTNTAETEALILANPEAAALLIMYMLDAHELTEHGGSVGGSWLTERGKQVAKVFSAEKVDEDDEP